MESPKEPSYHQSLPSTPEPKNLNPMIPNIEFFCAMPNALQAQTILVIHQSEKSAEVGQLKEETVQLSSNQTNSLSKEVESEGPFRKY